MKQLLSLFVSLICLSASAVAAADGDKIGNGGGLWACMSSSHEIQASVLVDFYEAQNQYGLSLISTSRSEPMDIVSDLETTIRAKFPDYASRWSTILRDVKSRIRYVPSELVVIEDSLFIVRPLASLCRTEWKYLQFANYTNYNEVLIRQDVWQSNMVSALDKAGLVWHEVIYRWMREQFEDKNSVRARRITGLLFSTKSADESRVMLNDILKGGDKPDPTEPVWVCLIRNNITSRYFLDYGNNQLAAKNQTLKTCKVGDSGQAFHCDEHGIRCDSFTSMKQKFTCAVQNNLNSNVYTETGRSLIEAEAKARRACSDAGEAFHCAPQVNCQY